MTQARLNTYTAGLTFLVIALAVLNWKIVPESTAAAIAAVVTMVFIWGVVAIKGKLAPRIKLGTTEWKFFTASVILAGLLLAFSLTAKLAGHIFDIESTLTLRARNVFSGFVLLYFANMIPKLIGPALKGKCSSAAANSLRRFSGWVLVLGALGYIGAWIFAPLSSSSTLAQICVGGAVILVGLRVLFCLIRERQLTI